MQVRKALLCDKVNVYSVDTMRQELVAHAHLSYQDDIQDLSAQIQTGELLQTCVALCCSVLQRAAACCIVLQRVAVCCSVVQCAAVWCSV